ncbi:MAG: hypothetical protein GX219_04580 [Tissierellia bacterium]|nr:hypothetical protein [Tissierellia bacterium]
MKGKIRIICIIFMLSLLFACGGKEQTDNQVEREELVSKEVESEEQESEEAKEVTYVKDADFSTKWASFPEITDAIHGDDVKRINGEIKDLADKYLKLYEDTGLFEDTRTVEYKTGTVDDILSISIYYPDPNTGGWAYKTYALNIKDGRLVTLEDIVKLAGLEDSDLEVAVSDYALAFYGRILKMDPSDENPMPSQYQAEVLKTFKDDFSSLNFFYDGKGLEIYPRLYIPSEPFEPFEHSVRVGKDRVKNLVDSSGYGDLLLRMTNPSKDLFSGQPDYIFKMEEGAGDQIVFVANTDDIFFSVNNYEFADDILSNVGSLETIELKKGESVLINTTVPEGIPNLGVSAKKANLSLEDVFSYNGMYGDLEVEYMPANDEYIIDENSDLYDMAVGKIFGEIDFEDEADKIWYSISTALSGLFADDPYFDSLFDDQGYFTVFSNKLDLVFRTMYPELEELPSLEDTSFNEYKAMYYDGSDDTYKFTLTYSPIIEYWIYGTKSKEFSQFAEGDDRALITDSIQIQLFNNETEEYSIYELDLKLNPNPGEFDYYYSLGDVKKIK